MPNTSVLGPSEDFKNQVNVKARAICHIPLQLALTCGPKALVEVMSSLREGAWGEGHDALRTGAASRTRSVR